MTIILAARYEIASRVAIKRGLKMNEWDYILTYDQSRGIRPSGEHKLVLVNSPGVDFNEQQLEVLKDWRMMRFPLEEVTT